MDSKVTYTQPIEAETLEEQNGGPHVVTSRKVGSIRGFFILAAALSLTIFIGLVVVAVINDINDRPWRDGYYGHSSEVANPKDCRFRLMSLDWLRPGCQDKAPVEKFRNFGPGDWFTDADLSEAFDEPCHVKDVPAEIEGRP